jgi:hypothetical protein
MDSIRSLEEVGEMGSHQSLFFTTQKMMLKNSRISSE